MRTAITVGLAVGLLLPPAGLRGQDLSIVIPLEAPDLSGVSNAAAEGLAFLLLDLLLGARGPAGPLVVDEVFFTRGHRSRSGASGPVRLILDAGASRQELEAVLACHDVLARSRVVGGSGSDDGASDTRARLERGAGWVRGLGGDALLVTHQSGLIGVLMRDARYIGHGDEEVLYALRRRVPAESPFCETAR